MLDAHPAFLTKPGKVTIDATGRVFVEGFEVDNGTCRDAAALAVVWALGHLQRELMKTLEAPGRNDICLG